MAMFVALLSLSFTSCSDDDDDKNDSVVTPGGDKDDEKQPAYVGSWKYTDEYGIGTVTINADGTFVDTFTEDGETYVERGRYTVNGNKITIYYGDGDVETGTYRVSGNTLTITDSEGYSRAFNKVVPPGSDKDDEVQPGYVGSWKYSDKDVNSTVTVNADGTYVFVDVFKEDGWTYVEKGRYTVDGNKITICNEDGDVETYTYRLSGNTITLTYDDGSYRSFTRVK